MIKFILNTVCDQILSVCLSVYLLESFYKLTGILLQESAMKLYKFFICLLFLESQEEDGDIEVEEAEGEENDRPYNLRQRKTVERYQAPPIGKREA